MFCRIPFAALAAVVGVALVCVNAQTPDCAPGRTYSVVLGDTCDSIGAAQKASTYQIETVNKDLIDQRCDNLHPGEVLCLGLTGKDCQEVAVVKSGDNCHAIASVAKTLPRLQQNHGYYSSCCVCKHIGGHQFQ